MKRKILALVLCLSAYAIQAQIYPQGKPWFMAHITMGDAQCVGMQRVLADKYATKNHHVATALQLMDLVAYKDNAPLYATGTLVGKDDICIVVAMDIDSLKNGFWDLYNKNYKDSDFIAIQNRDNHLTMVLQSNHAKETMDVLQKQEEVPTNWQIPYWSELPKKAGDFMQLNMEIATEGKGKSEASKAIYLVEFSDGTVADESIIRLCSVNKPDVMDELVNTVASVSQKIGKLALSQVPDSLIQLPTRKNPNYAYANLKEILSSSGMENELKSKMDVSNTELKVPSEVFLKYEKDSHMLSITTKGSYKF